MHEPVITEILGADPELVRALAEAHLPTDDLHEPGRHFFRFADKAGLIGFIGWEELGEAAMIRSLVVVPARRHQGWGRAMLDWALLRLAELGAPEAFILTTTIEGLCKGLGFRVLDRDAAPPALRATRQFGALCPSFATLLQRSLP